MAVLHVNGRKSVVDIAGNWVSVMFFDGDDRLCIKYDFKRLEPGQLFLSLAAHFEYDENPQPRATVTFAFQTDGAIIIESRNKASGDLEEKNSRADPAASWEQYPEFGDYRSICRLSREM